MRTATTTITTIIADFVSMFTALFDVVRGVLLPAGGQDPVSTLAWFGLLASTIAVPIGFLKSMVSRGKK